MYAGQAANSCSGRTAESRPERKVRSGRGRKEVLRPMAAALRLLGLLRGVDRGLHHIAVLLEPRLGALDRALLGLSVLQRDELLIAEPEIFDKRVGHRLIIGEILVDYGGDLRGLVEIALGVLWVLKVAEVEHPPQVLGATPWIPPRDFTTHRIRAPGREHERVLGLVEALHLCEHRGRARRLVLEIEVVLGDYVLIDLCGDYGTRLDADDPVGLRLIQIG